MNDFEDIRPYNDSEVAPTISRLLGDGELIDAVTRLRFPRASGPLGWALRPLVRQVLTRQLATVNSVHDFQMVVEKYMRRMIENTTTGLTSSGLDKLDASRPYLFISNHRDITMDPGFVNWTLYHAGFNTLRIAIGDNLLTKPYVTDLMRINKSFIVNRSAKAPREKLKAAKKLSAYIHHSITAEQANIWIAQREGRAKDGKDKTNPAVVGMLALNRPKGRDFGDYIQELSIVPVSISYEWDPCDGAKARELYLQQTTGEYQKGDQEDVRSIALGIAGQKGHVHVAYGDVLGRDFADSDEVAEEIDRQVWRHQVLHPSNCFAYQQLEGEAAALTVGAEQRPFVAAEFAEAGARFEQRLLALPVEHRDLVRQMYANPVRNKLAMQDACG